MKMHLSAVFLVILNQRFALVQIKTVVKCIRFLSLKQQTQKTTAKKSFMSSVIRFSVQRQFQNIENSHSLLSFLKRPYYANIQIPTFIWGS